MEGRTAIISDIHGNLEAFHAILKDIESRNKQYRKKGTATIDRIWCLGDTVGYLANPVECLELAIDACDIVLAGNHEIATRAKTDNVNLGLTKENGMGGVGAPEGVLWTQRQLFGDSTPIQGNYSEAEKHNKDLITKVRSADYGSNLARELSDNLSRAQIPVSWGFRNRTVDVPSEVYSLMLIDRSNERKIRKYFRKIDAAEKGEELLSYLKSLPVQKRIDDVLLVHDNEEKPGNFQYMFPPGSKRTKDTYPIGEEVYERLADDGIKHCFFGHRHKPKRHLSKKHGVQLVDVGALLPRGTDFVWAYTIWNADASFGRDITHVKGPLNEWEWTNQKCIDAGLVQKLLTAYKISKGEEL